MIIEQEESPMIICAWCSTVKSEGSLPATHSICDDCAREIFGAAFGAGRKETPPVERSPLHDGYSTRRREWPAWSVLVWSMLFLCAGGLSAQVTATAELRNGVTELRVMNSTTAPLTIDLSLFRDATKAGGTVTLGDSINALISPRSFVLQSGQVQAVRIKVRDSVTTGEMLRLATMFTPQSADTAAGMRLIFRTRLITKVVAAAP